MNIIGLPKDILRLLLTRFLSPCTAVDCYLKLRLFHDACDECTLSTIKKRYFRLFHGNAHDTQFIINPEPDAVICMCGAQVTTKNVHFHQRKCGYNKLMPNVCPKCDKPLITTERGGRLLVLRKHFKSAECVATNSELRRRIMKAPCRNAELLQPGSVVPFLDAVWWIWTLIISVLCGLVLWILFSLE